MLEAYILCRKNSIRTSEYYAEHYPLRQQPDRRYFRILYNQFRLHDCLFRKKRTKKNIVVNEEVEITVLAYFEAYREFSIRDAAKELGLSYSSVQRILKKHKYIPFKFRISQTLQPGDSARRLTFCHWFVNFCDENLNGAQCILWSDETNFTNRGMFNKKNSHYWSQENLLIVRPHAAQVRFSFNVWCGLIGSVVVGPVFYNGTLTGNRYMEFIRNVLEDFLDNANYLMRQNLYFQQDGAPAHNYHLVQTYLDTIFAEKWIGTNGPIQWPARSPDLSPLDFFLWGYLKNEVYKTRYDNVRELQDKVREVFRQLDRRTILRATQSVLKRARKCIEQEGDTFEQYL